MQNRLENFNITKLEKFNDTVSDSTLKLIFKKLPFVDFGIGTKNSLKMLSEYFSLF